MTANRRDIWLILGLVVLPTIGGCGLMGESAESAHREMLKTQDTSKEALLAKGARFDRKMYPPHGGAWAVDLTGVKALDDPLFEELKKVGQIAEISFAGTSLADEHMPKVADPAVASTFLRVDLSKTRITNRGLAELHTARFLKELNLSETGVTRDGVATFRKRRNDDPQVFQEFKNVKIIGK
ncbi:MAG: hypothetical protein ACT4QC_20860 [Planctomycetaceae bacterium]